MAQNPVDNALLPGLASLVGSTIGEEELKRQFTGMLTEYLALDLARFREIGDTSKVSPLDEYVINTKRPYADNQLSEYSSFPELIEYRNAGYGSCALVPVLIDGKVAFIIELLSKAGGRFTDQMLGPLSTATLIFGLSATYKRESARNLRVANYFNGAFAGPLAQMLVSDTGAIIKYNKRAAKEFGLAGGKGSTVGEAVGVPADRLFSLPDGGSETVPVGQGAQRRLYSIYANRISDRLLHVAAQDRTDVERMGRALDLMGRSTYSGVAYLDDGARITEATASLERALGYPQGALAGKSVVDLVYERDRDELRGKLAKAPQSQKFEQCTPSFMSNGSLPVLMRVAVSRWMNGYLMVFSDSRAEQYLGSLGKALGDFIANTTDMVMRVDEFGYIKECNMQVEAVLKYSMDDVAGRELKSLYTDEAIVERDFGYVRNGTKVDNSYVYLKAKSGAIVPATHSVRGFRDMDNSVSYVVMIKELDTKRRLHDLELALRDLTKRSERLKVTSKLKSEFIYNISHELKTPLTNIKGFSKLLYDGAFGAVNDEQKEYITTILDEADRLMQIIQQILDASKLESDKVKLELKEVDLWELLNTASIKSLEETARSKGLRFSWDVAFDVPSVSADSNRLIQVFVNLIYNAIKFTEKGGISVKIKRRKRSFVECEIIDTGVGITEEDQRKLFRKFYQATTRRDLVKQAESGTGLGLSIAKEIVRLHQGQIGVESKPNEGSKFWFTLRINPRPKKREAVQ